VPIFPRNDPRDGIRNDEPGCIGIAAKISGRQRVPAYRLVNLHARAVRQQNLQDEERFRFDIPRESTGCFYIRDESFGRLRLNRHSFSPALIYS